MKDCDSSAFPVPLAMESFGMTLRQYAAIAIAAALSTNSNAPDRLIVTRAIAIADELLSQLEEGNDEQPARKPYTRP